MTVVIRAGDPYDLIASIHKSYSVCIETGKSDTS